MFGRLTMDAFKHDMIENAAGYSMLIGLIVIVYLMFHHQRWKWVWKEYITSLDPKKIGVMYLVVAFLCSDQRSVRCVDDAGAADVFCGGLVRLFGTRPLPAALYRSRHHDDLLCRDGYCLCPHEFSCACPNWRTRCGLSVSKCVSFYLYAVGAGLVVLSLVVGVFSGAGWVTYPPLSGLAFSPGVGVDYWIWSVQIAGIGSLFSGLNFFVTIVKMRCSWHDPDENADLHLGYFRSFDSHSVRFSYFDCNDWHARLWTGIWICIFSLRTLAAIP